MPELPEVRTVAFHLDKKISGKAIKSIVVRLPKIIKDTNVSTFKDDLKNRKILKVANEGKWIIIHLENNLNIIVHLRLEGKFRTIENLLGVNPQHDHIIFKFHDGTYLYFNDTRQFGTFHLKGKNYLNEKPINQLGKKLDEVDIDELYFLFQRKRIPIKSSLLDQRLLIGLGNIYVNEVLWWTKVDPQAPTNKIKKLKLKQIIKKSHEIMEKSYEMGGSSIATYSSLDGIEGQYQKELMVHGKQGEECKRCKTKISKIKVGGRGTYLCKKCQN